MSTNAVDSYTGKEIEEHRHVTLFDESNVHHFDVATLVNSRMYNPISKKELDIEAKRDIENRHYTCIVLVRVRHGSERFLFTPLESTSVSQLIVTIGKLVCEGDLITSDGKNLKDMDPNTCIAKLSTNRSLDLNLIVTHVFS